MAGVVEANYAPATAAELKSRDGGDVVPQAPKTREIDSQHVRKDCEDDEVVGDQAGSAAGMALRDEFHRLGGPPLHILKTLSSRHSRARSFSTCPQFEEAGVSLADLRECEAVQVSDVHFDEPRFDLDRKLLVGRGDWPGRLNRSHKWAGVDSYDWVA